MGDLGAELAAGHRLQGRDLDGHQRPGGRRLGAQLDRRGRRRAVGAGRALDRGGDGRGRRGQPVAVGEVGALDLGLGQGGRQGSHGAGDEGPSLRRRPAGRPVLGDGDARQGAHLLPAAPARPADELADPPAAPVGDGLVPGAARGGLGTGQEGDDGAGGGLGHVDAAGGVDLVVVDGDLHAPGRGGVGGPGRERGQGRGGRGAGRTGGCGEGAVGGCGHGTDPSGPPWPIAGAGRGMVVGEAAGAGAVAHRGLVGHAGGARAGALRPVGRAAVRSTP